MINFVDMLAATLLQQITSEERKIIKQKLEI